ncbi:type II toxin-antitoxin system RelE/ParE family toxin [Sporosarcina sp. FSL W7-1349]|uniref:type II toxin-antitoxin system RelE/ParE family toxin n=1 Tax=Bacillales TaxID=1385 RepID=UPI000582006F|nr:type II toxin-antitoxin system RelE/ParE family toxin [Bacillus sp. OxB-1]BAQ10150.1 hypothetical protein OXB_1679 [Bacillus sp. OxB-1]
MNRQVPLKLEILPRAKRFFKSIRRDKELSQKFQKQIKNLQLNPSLGTLKSGDLGGVFSMDIRHNKVEYELAYCVEQLEDGKILLIILAGTRENFYNELKTYMKTTTRLKRH